jgi:hypothetical protein
MERLIYQNKVFDPYEYSNEDEFERVILEHANDIFGPKSVFINIKKRIGEDNIVTIPDGYIIDFSFEKDPRLYIIEIELVTHDPYKHIGQQLLRFAISYKASGRNIKAFLLENVLKEKSKKDMVEQGFKKAGFRNIDAFFESIIFEKPVAAIVIVDQSTDDLANVLNQLTMKTDIIEFQRFISDHKSIFKFTPFQQEIRPLTEAKKPRIRVEEIDTIVVPANEEGFKEVFLKQKCWYQIRISSAMIERIKYIAGYQTAPISAITYSAEVARIEKYKNTGKYIVYFKSRAKKFGPVKLSEKDKGLAPQAPRYTSFRRLRSAKTIGDVF